MISPAQLVCLCTILLCAAKASAYPYIDTHYNELQTELHKAFREPLTRNLLAWARQASEKGELDISKYETLQNASCDETLSRDCLIEHYLKRYHRKRRDAFVSRHTFNVTFDIYCGVRMVSTAFYLAVAYYMGLFTNDRFLIRCSRYLLYAKSAEEVFNLLFFGAMESYGEYFANNQKQLIVRAVLKEAEDAYLQLMLEFLAGSSSALGLTNQKAIYQAEEMYMPDFKPAEPVSVTTFSSYGPENFSGNDRRLVMLNKNMVATGFFKVFINAPVGGGIRIVLEAAEQHYELSVTDFSLTPVLALLRAGNIQGIQLQNVYRP